MARQRHLRREHDEVGLRRRSLGEEGGFTLVEFMIAGAISIVVLGGTVMLATQIQQGYSTQLDDVTAEEEARFALDWIARVLRPAGSNPYGIVLSACPVANTAFQGLRLDPNANGIQDDVRIQADINPPNGLLVGASAVCTEQGEDITIAHDPEDLVITRRDHAVDAAGVAMTEPIFTALLFTYLNAARTTTTDPDAIVYAQVSLTAQSKAFNPITQEYTTSTLQTEVRLRTR